MAFTVTEVPGLPGGFTDTFTSTHVSVAGVRLHAVTGGSGPALLLLPGWPEFWYGWRLVMPRLAEHFTVIALDLRGLGDSDAPARGYDPLTLAADTSAVMTALGHSRFAVAGYDLGMIVGYALAATEPDRVSVLWAAEAILPGVTELPGLGMSAPLNEYLWHFSFNRLATINDEMVAGREEIYFGHQFRSKAATPQAIDTQAIDLFVDAVRRPAHRRACFEYYRVSDENTQIRDLVARGKISTPVVAVGAELGSGTIPIQAMRVAAAHVTEAIVPHSGHFVPEEAPDWTAESIIAAVTGNGEA